MATKSPASTISYNSEEFLHNKLDNWVRAHWIQSYQYIKHKGEDGDKDHIHLRIEPNKTLDLMDLTTELYEYDPNHKKPLGVLCWRPSKEEDWILYALHDKQYLKLKSADSKDGKIPYTIDNIVTSDNYDKEIVLLRARQHLEQHTACIIKKIKTGTRVSDLIEEGYDVFRVKAVVQSLQMTDYENLAIKIQSLERQYNALRKAIYEAEGEIEQDENKKLHIKFKSNKI